MEKFQEAVSYNYQRNLTVSNSKKKLPNVKNEWHIIINQIMTQNVQTQTEFLPTCTIHRFYSIYNGGPYGQLSKIFYILNSGFGCLLVDKNLAFTNFFLIKIFEL